MRPKWKREQKDFQLGLRRLKHLKEKVDLEVGVASQEQIEKRYAEIAHSYSQQAIESATLTPRSIEPTRNIFSVPYPRNTRFYGRQNIIADMHKDLSSGERTMEMMKFVALCGLGGSGKTQLALEYVYRHRDSYEACIWISCDTPIKAAQGFIDVARKLEVENAQQQHQIALVKDWLCDSCKF